MVTRNRPYRTLDPKLIVMTAGKLRSRVAERFPQSGLSQVSAELELIAGEAANRTERIQRPSIAIRTASIALIVLLILIILLFARGIKPDTVEKHLSDALDVAQFAESTLGVIVFIGAAMIFLFTLDNRIRRGRSLEAIYELRSLAHVVDMHQLTKDPERLTKGPSTPSSPERKMSAFELGRYLDYCTELLSLISKVAVLYAQGVKDDDVLDAVDQIETLTTGLSRKIWQKIVLLDRIRSTKSDFPTAG